MTSKIKFMQDKKGMSEGMGALLSLLLVFMVLGSLFYGIYYFNFVWDKIHNDACNKLDFKEHGYIGGIDYCRDYGGNLHYIEMDCGKYLFFPEKCVAKEIKVGETWGLKE